MLTEGWWDFSFQELPVKGYILANTNMGKPQCNISRIRPGNQTIQVLSQPDEGTRYSGDKGKISREDLEIILLVMEDAKLSSCSCTNLKELSLLCTIDLTVSYCCQGLLQDLRDGEQGAIVLFHACAHNPTGVDPTMEQWEDILQVVKKTQMLPFFDSAYQVIILIQA